MDTGDEERSFSLQHVFGVSPPLNRRKWAALGLVLQDSASENVTESALEALKDWASWNRGELEQECTDFLRLKRTREAEESKIVDTSAKNV